MERLTFIRKPAVGDLIVFLAGCLMPFAWEPFGFKWLALLALIIWVALLYPEGALRRSFMFGLGWFGTGGWWLTETLTHFGNLPLPVGMLCVLLLGSVLAIPIALWGWLTMKLAGRTPWMIVIFPSAGVLAEWLRGWLFSGLPWTPLGSLLLDTPFVGWLAILGVYGCTLLVAFVAVTSLPLWFDRSKEALKREGFILLLLLPLLSLYPAPYQADGAPLKVALVQANIPQDVKWDESFLAETMFRYARLTDLAVAKADLVVWPEAAVPFVYNANDGSWGSWLNNKLQQWNKPVLFGGVHLIPGSSDQIQSGLFGYAPNQPLAFVGKEHLVPFGEYVPSWLPFIHRLVPEIGDFIPDDHAAPITIGHFSFGTLICYDAIFPEIGRKRANSGAGILVNVSNDAWYFKTPAAWQHLAAARVRAVETGRYMVRAANTGITTIIAPDGKLTGNLPWFSEGIYYGTVHSSNVVTPYMRMGDGPLLIGLSLLLAAVGWWVRRGKKHD